MKAERRQFLDNSKRLVGVLGDWVPPCTKGMLEEAERLIRGEICPEADGSAWIRMDFANIDWTGAKTSNPYVAQRVLMLFGLLTPLAAAYRQTGDERFARSARQYMEAFLRASPIRDGWNPVPHDGPTSYPHRIGGTGWAGWLGTLPVFLDSPAFDDAFFDQTVVVARTWISYLAQHLYPGRNIRILHADVLLISGLRLSFLSEAAAWRAAGVRIMNDAVARQILPDGADMEGSPEYHCDVMYLLATIWKLARSYSELGLEIPDAKLAAMFDYALAAHRPDGALNSMNDTGYSPSTGQFGDHVVCARREFRAAAGLPDRMPEPCLHFPGVGQVFLRDQWGPDATYITFDATTRRGWHWQPGRNGIQLFANHRGLLVDPGYPFESAQFPFYGHRTAHHSTLNLNGWNQSHTDVRLRFRQAPGYDLVDGLYSGGYWPATGIGHGDGIFGEHYRTLLWIRNRCVVVIDHLNTTSEPGKKPTLESVWQLGEGAARVREDGRSVVTGHPDSNLLMLFPLMPAGMQVSIHAGERSPMRGWVVSRWHVCCSPAPMVRLSVPEYDPWNASLATVLIPFPGTEAPWVTASASGSGDGLSDRTAGRLDLQWADGSSDLVVWSARIEEAIDTQHGIDTDAALVHLQFNPARELVQGLAVDGRFLRVAATGGGDVVAKIQRI